MKLYLKNAQYFLHLDWEFPADRGGTKEDKPNFTKFIQEFRQYIEEEILDENNSSKLILSAAVAAGKKRIDEGYEVSQIALHLDFINLMAFDFKGSW
jgi:GH18 family chitinase